jgi:hypothetical protein
MLRQVDGEQVAPLSPPASSVMHVPPLQICPPLAQSRQATPPVPHVLAEVTAQLRCSSQHALLHVWGPHPPPSATATSPAPASPTPASSASPLLASASPPLTAPRSPWSAPSNQSEASEPIGPSGPAAVASRELASEPSSVGRLGPRLESQASTQLPPANWSSPEREAHPPHALARIAALTIFEITCTLPVISRSSYSTQGGSYHPGLSETPVALRAPFEPLRRQYGRDHAFNTVEVARAVPPPLPGGYQVGVALAWLSLIGNPMGPGVNAEPGSSDAGHHRPRGHCCSKWIT